MVATPNTPTAADRASTLTGWLLFGEQIDNLGQSFFVNFLWRREFRAASLLGMLGLAVQPVLRVAGIIGVMLLALAVALLQPWVARTDVFAVIVIAAKILVDWNAHRAERRRLQAAASGLQLQGTMGM